MVELLTKHAIEIFFGLVSAGALALCKHFWNKNKQLEEMQKADQNRQYRQMIVDEIEPIVNELTRLKAEIIEIENKSKENLILFKDNMEAEHETMNDNLNKVQDEIENHLNLIINSYKFRLIQLCKTHLRDGFITESDFEQISELYKLYHGLGGNGQAQEYYEKVLQLDIRSE